MPTAQQLNGFNAQLPIIGEITQLDANARTLDVRTRSGNVFKVHARDSTWFDAVKNLDRLDRRRPRLCTDDGNSSCWENLRVGDIVAVEGIYSRHGEAECYDALAIHELVSHQGYYHFEHTFWWIAQIDALGDRWLDNMFGDKSTYVIDDFSALYRTALNIEGLRVEQEGDKQEMATLSRLIYGLASAYLMSGDERFFQGARAGVEYQREAFRSISADGRFCFWIHARMRDRYGRFDVLECLFADDRGTFPLYEQIYALAGLAQYYRITNDWEVLYDIQRTIAAFNMFFADRHDPNRGHDGFFSHIDPVEFSPLASKLRNEPGGPSNQSQKNWNSVGDHLPAYLINLLLALDPLPEIGQGPDAAEFGLELGKFRATCREILDVTADLIARKFPQEGSPYVCERFDRDWNPNYGWGWQQNRGIVGHNLKIAWNLTRVANLYLSEGREADARRMFDVALKLAQDMARLGIDQLRSGVFDAVERNPRNGMPMQFAWLNTKDFWQQEQGILAYLIMFGHSAMTHPDGVRSDLTKEFLKLARELQAFWNLYFLDRDRNGIFFRVGDNGNPVISATYGDKGSHSKAGYHVFELCYLAHVYQRTYLPREQRHHSGLVLHFRPSASRFRSINVLPDFLGPDTLEILEVTVDGVPRKIDDPRNFQLPLLESDQGRKILVRFQQTEKLHKTLSPMAIEDKRHF
jgi:mannose/cellobiose epimerase-like protein (N-acyl-D-glucosamine 2-epimerase family)